MPNPPTAPNAPSAPAGAPPATPGAPAANTTRPVPPNSAAASSLGVVSPPATLDIFIIRKTISAPGVPIPSGAYVYLRKMQTGSGIYRLSIGERGAVTASHILHGTAWDAVASGISVQVGSAYAAVWQMGTSAPESSALDAQLVAANAYTPVQEDFGDRRFVVANQIHARFGPRLHAVFPTSAFNAIEGHPVSWTYLTLRRVTFQLDIQGSLGNAATTQVGGGTQMGAEGQVTSGNYQGSASAHDLNTMSTAHQYSLFKSVARANDPNSISGWQLSSVGGLSRSSDGMGGADVNANLGLQLSCPGVTFGPVDHPLATVQTNITFNLYERQRDPSQVTHTDDAELTQGGSLESRIGVVLAEVDIAHPFVNSTVALYDMPGAGLFGMTGAQTGTFAFNGSVTLKIVFELVPNWRAIGRQLAIRIAELGLETAVAVVIAIAGAVLTVLMTAFSIADFDAFEDFCYETRQQLYMFCLGYVMACTGNGIIDSATGTAFQQAREGFSAGTRDLEHQVAAHPGASMRATQLAARGTSHDTNAINRLYEQVFAHTRAHYWDSVMTFCQAHYADNTDFHRQVASNWLDDALPGTSGFNRMSHDPALANLFTLVTYEQLQQQVNDEAAQHAPASSDTPSNLPPLRVTGTAQ